MLTKISVKWYNMGKLHYRMHSSVVDNVKEMEGNVETLLKTNDKESNRGTLTIGNFGFP